MVGKLNVLLWKHFVVRRRRFIHTPIEFISPLVFFILLFAFKNKLNPVSKYDNDSGNIHYTESIGINEIHPPRTVFYTPDTGTTRQLMQKVGVKINLPPRNDPTGRGYFPISNETEIPTMARDYGVIIFQDMDEEDFHLPEKLNYTIRVKLPYTSIVNDIDTDTLGQHPAYGRYYEPFIRLQWAVDSTFLELKSDTQIKQKLSLQEFPYATSAKYAQVSFMCVLLEFSSWGSLVLVFVFLSSRLLDERITGIREMIQMVGVPSRLLHLSHFLNVMPAGVLYSVVGTILVTVGPNPVLRESSPALVWLLLALYYVSVVAMAFATSCMLSKAQYAVTFASLMYVGYRMPSQIVVQYSIPPWLLPLTGLLPHVPMQWFWLNVAALEEYGDGITFGNMAQSHAENTSCVLVCYLLLLLQAALFGALAWYLQHVCPGPYGQPYPWTFFCQADFWNKKKVTPDEEMEELEEVDTSDSRYFEPPLQNADIGIKVVNVSKVFPKHKALSNVSLNVYKGEITVLLGHNGAGKTTLMSIITGLLSATEGKVYVEGLDTVTQKEEMRNHLGLCPQHNLFFSDLTILEHVMFFTLLKGRTFAEAKNSSMKLLEQLGLAVKADCSSGQLSGGMKRRLQLACALAGDASVLVLDEPTSGLDVETRRELWDLLLSLRGSRAVLLSTHFMEEADALGDRVAALHAGRLRCAASPMHLKRAVGTGYRLTCTTVGLPNERGVSVVVTSHVPDATLKEQSLNVVSYNLPASSTRTFPQLFNELESKRSELGIDSIGVGISTLEEVFIKLCSDVTTTFTDDDVDGVMAEPLRPKYTGMSLYLRQFCALFKRHFQYILANKISFLVMQVILPLLVIISTTISCNSSHVEPQKQLVAMNLDLYKNMADRRALYSLNTTNISLKTVKDLYPDVKATSTSDVVDEILSIGLRDIIEYNKYLIGVEINDTDVRILFTTVRHHAAPAAANVLANLLALQLLGASPPHAITTYNLPLDNHEMTRRSIVEPKSLALLVTWAGIVVFVVMSTLINAVSLPCRERAAGARQLHALAGARPALLWAAALAAHALTYALLLALPVLAAAAAIDTDSTIDQHDFLGTLFLALLVGIMAFLSFMYLVSFYFGERGAGALMVAAVIIFGFITPLLSTAADVLQSEQRRGFTYYVVALLGLLLPPHAFTSAVMKAAFVASNNARHDLNRNWPDFTRRCYLCFEENSPGDSMLVLFIQFLVYMTLVILTEYGQFNSIWDRVFNARYTESDPADADEMVRAEKAYVRKAIELPKEKIPDALLAYNLHKKYPKIFGKSCNAVKGVSFSVKKGECFGLLGVNGAGKSTIFKMLTGIEHPTRGNVFANGYYLNYQYGQYLRSLGYCPQFFGLDEFLSGADNLRLLLTLRGLAPGDVDREAQAWIETVGLEKYSQRAVSSYSGGCARRLAAAAALCGGRRAVLLDEPSAGVDVAARRRLWAAVRRAASASAVVISSHSMDETEALCGRIAIVSAGRVRALGAAGALRAAYAAGHAVVLRVSGHAHGDRGTGADVTDSAKSDVLRLKSKLHDTFNCTLKDEHKTMLHYHINDTMRYSELFAKLEELRNDFPDLIQDYSVTETTLEEVFLSFAREENPFDGPTPV